MPEKSMTSDVKIVNKRGLHARASSRFATEAGRFNAEIEVCKDGSCVVGTSIMGLLMLGASMGETITLSAEGPEAKEALEDLVALIDARFGEDE